MELLLVAVLGLLYAAGVYLILRRSMVKLLLGIMLLISWLVNGSVTAIVISFALTAFAIVLLKRVYALVDSDDLDDLNTPEEEDI